MTRIEYKLVRQRLNWAVKKNDRTIADVNPPGGAGWVLQSVPQIDQEYVYSVWQRAATDAPASDE